MASSGASFEVQGSIPDLREGDVVRLSDSACDMAKDIHDIASQLKSMIPPALALNGSQSLNLQDPCVHSPDFKAWIDFGVNFNIYGKIFGSYAATALIGSRFGCRNHEHFAETDFSMMFDTGFFVDPPRPSFGGTVQFGFGWGEQKKQFLDWGVFAKLIGNLNLEAWGFPTRTPGGTIGFKLLPDFSFSEPKAVKLAVRFKWFQEEEELLRARLDEATKAARNSEEATASALAASFKFLRGVGIEDKVKATLPSPQGFFEAAARAQNDEGSLFPPIPPLPRTLDFAVGVDMRFCLSPTCHST